MIFTGIYEALELRDGGAAYMGKGVSKAVDHVNSIIGPAILGRDAEDQKGLDAYMVQVRACVRAYKREIASVLGAVA